MTWLAFIAAACPVVAFLFSLGCGCGVQLCTNWCSDSFTRADNTDINTSSPAGCGWTEVNGNSEIASNKLKFTSAMASAKSSGAGSSVENIIPLTAVTFDSLSTASCARMMMDFVDNDNYLAFELSMNTSGSGTIQLVRRASGSDTTIQSETIHNSLASGGTAYMCMSYDGTNVLCVAAAVNTVPINDFGYAAFIWCNTETITTNKLALGTGATITGSISFAEFTPYNFQSPDDERYTRNCESCWFGAGGMTNKYDLPLEFTVVLSGLTGALAGLNGTYTLYLNATFLVGVPQFPRYTYNDASGGEVLVVAFTPAAESGLIDVSCDLYDVDGHVTYTAASWDTRRTSNIVSISSLNVPYASCASCTGGTSVASSSTCTITAA